MLKTQKSEPILVLFVVFDDPLKFALMIPSENRKKLGIDEDLIVKPLWDRDGDLWFTTVFGHYW